MRFSRWYTGTFTRRVVANNAKHCEDVVLQMLGRRVRVSLGACDPAQIWTRGWRGKGLISCGLRDLQVFLDFDVSLGAQPARQGSACARGRL